jgi:predicted ATPase
LLLKLRRFTIENYKALGYVDVHVRSDILFLIGVNGAGKSSLLQALSLVRYFRQGQTGQFFKDRGWTPGDVRPRTVNVAPLRAATGDEVHQSRGRNLVISLALEDEGYFLLWRFEWSYLRERSLDESVWILDPGDTVPRRVFGVTNGKVSGVKEIARLSLLPGSVFDVVRPEDIGSSDSDTSLLEKLKVWTDGIISLELLDPTTMRSRLRGDGPGVGPQGERLATFLADLPADAKDRVVQRMARFYPINGLDTTRKRTGLIDIKVAEAFKLIGRVDLTHMSDGFLRILALCAIPELGEQVGLVLLDEVEDGIEPHILPQLIEVVAAESHAQLVMTSHSPLLINFFEQEQIYLMGRDPRGHTVGAEAATLKPFQQGDAYFGSGEIWANAGLNAINEALRSIQPPRRRITESRTPQDLLEYLRA